MPAFLWFHSLNLGIERFIDERFSENYLIHLWYHVSTDYSHDRQIGSFIIFRSSEPFRCIHPEHSHFLSWVVQAAFLFFPAQCSSNPRFQTPASFRQLLLFCIEIMKSFYVIAPEILKITSIRLFSECCVSFRQWQLCFRLTEPDSLNTKNALWQNPQSTGYRNRISAPVWYVWSILLLWPQNEYYQKPSFHNSS